MGIPPESHATSRRRQHEPRRCRLCACLQETADAEEGDLRGRCEELAVASNILEKNIEAAVQQKTQVVLTALEI